jgi:hypothetical protein
MCVKRLSQVEKDQSKRCNRRHPIRPLPGGRRHNRRQDEKNLVRVLPSGSTVVLFGQGRALGGRTSVRRGRAEDGRRIAPEDAAPASYHAWDHGCQFFRADTAESRSSILPDWLGAKFAMVWMGRFAHHRAHARLLWLPTGKNPESVLYSGLVNGKYSTALNLQDFSSDLPVYQGVGGMHAASWHRKDIEVKVKVRGRVAAIERVASGVHGDRWQLLGTTGEAAFHDRKEALAAQAQNVPCSDLLLDALLVTDASASWPADHLH